MYVCMCVSMDHLTQLPKINFMLKMLNSGPYAIMSSAHVNMLLFVLVCVCVCVCVDSISGRRSRNKVSRSSSNLTRLHVDQDVSE